MAVVASCVVATEKSVARQVPVHHPTVGIRCASGRAYRPRATYEWYAMPELLTVGATYGKGDCSVQRRCGLNHPAGIYRLITRSVTLLIVFLVGWSGFAGLGRMRMVGSLGRPTHLRPSGLGGVCRLRWPIALHRACGTRGSSRSLRRRPCGYGRLRTVDWRAAMAGSTMHRWPIWMAQRRWWRSTYDRALVPLRTLAIERPVAIVVVPVGTDHEGDDRYADLRTVGRQQHRPILILVFDVVAGDPVAIVVDDHVTPFPAVGSASHIDFSTGRNPIDQRIAHIGPARMLTLPAT